MARGWESKSIEAQQDDAARQSTRDAGQVEPDETTRRQAIGGLLLSRARAESDRSAASQPARRAALDAAIQDLEARLAALGHHLTGR